MTRSRGFWLWRVVAIVGGAVVVLFGLAARGIEDEYGGTHSELVTQADGSVVVYEPVDDIEAYGVEAVDDSTWAVFGPDGNELFRGSEHGVHEWRETVTRVQVFAGSPDQARAWDEARQADARDMLIPNLVVIAGVLVFVAGLILGWKHSAAADHREHVDTMT